MARRTRGNVLLVLTCAMLLATPPCGAEDLERKDVKGTRNGTNRINIVFLPDGFTSDQLTENAGATWPITGSSHATGWAQACSSMADGFLKASPISAYKEYFYFSQVAAASTTQGTSFHHSDGKSPNIDRTTRFGTVFNDGTLALKDPAGANAEVERIVGESPADAVVIMPNTKEFGSINVQTNGGPGTQCGIALVTFTKQGPNDPTPRTPEKSSRSKPFPNTVVWTMKVPWLGKLFTPNPLVLNEQEASTQGRY